MMFRLGLQSREKLNTFQKDDLYDISSRDHKTTKVGSNIKSSEEPSKAEASTEAALQPACI